jgi:hypothetical protein
MNVTLPIHVSIISDYGSEFRPAQEKKLNNTLFDIWSNYERQVVLHHGCISEADNIAHRGARGVGWRIEGHPACAPGSVAPRQAASIWSELAVLHPARPRDDRDQDLIWVSTVIVAAGSERGRISSLASQATDAGCSVVRIGVATLRAIQPSAVTSLLPVHDLTDVWR